MLLSMKELLNNFLRKDFSSSRFWLIQIQNFFKFIYFIKQGVFGKYCLQRAAGMAYSSLLAMVPTLVVVASIISSIKVFPADLKIKLQNFIFTNLIPETSEKLNQKIALYVQEFTNSAGTIGLIGLVFMFITVVFLLNSIENTFNSIMNAATRRSFLHKISAYTCLVVYTLFFVWILIILQKTIPKEIFLISKLSMIYHYVLIALTFTFVYKLIPNTFVSFKDALTGGIWATILIKVAHKSFSHYIVKIVNYDKIYGTLGAIPLFLIWLFMVWIVVLIGIEITYVSKNKETLYSSFKSVLSIDTKVLLVLESLYITYKKGKKPESADSIIYRLNLSKNNFHEIMEILIDNEIVTKLENNRYTLAKNPDFINLFACVSLFFESFDFTQQTGEAKLVYTPLKSEFVLNNPDISLSKWAESRA